MSLYPDFGGVVAELGDKVIEGFAAAVRDTRVDLAAYRGGSPHFVAQASERGLANWIHDRLWFHLVARLGHLPEVQVTDHEPHRELRVGLRYRFRVKRHSDLGQVSTYPTQTALDFLEQDPLQLAIEGMDEVRLIVGYVWDADTRAIGPAVISLRANRDTVVWMEELPGPASRGSGEDGVTTPLPPRPGPVGPTIEVPSANEAESDGDDV